MNTFMEICAAVGILVIAFAVIVVAILLFALVGDLVLRIRERISGKKIEGSME